MLASIPAWKFTEWKIFEDLDPDLPYRVDWGLAHVVQAIMRNGKQLKEFMLPFGDSDAAGIIPQTIEYQEMVIDAWVKTNNTIVKRREGAGSG